MNNEQVGKISYQVEIDVEGLRSGAKSVEQAVKTTFGDGVTREVGKADKAVDQFNQTLKNTEKGLKPIVTASAVASAAIVAGFTSASKAAFDQVRAVENASFGLKAYEKDARAVEVVLSSLVKFARSDQGVLFNRTELFATASTLKGYGDATRDLTDHTRILAKATAAGGADMNELAQIVGSAAQQGRLSAIAYDQLASRMIILPDSMRGATVAAEDLFEALDNALPDSLIDDRATTIEGRLIRLQSAWRDLGGQILGVDADTSKFIEGGLGDLLVRGLSGLRDFIAENKKMIVSVGAGVVAFGGLTTAIFGTIKVIASLRTAMIALGATSATVHKRLGLIGAISLAMGVGVGFLVDKFVDMGDSAESADNDIDELLKTLDDSSSFDDGSKAAAELSEKLGELAEKAKEAREEFKKQSKQLKDDYNRAISDMGIKAKKATRDYEESLAKIVKSHQDTVLALTKQINDETANYNAAFKQRLAKFEESQGKEESAHLEKTRNLENQIDFLTKVNNDANKQQLSELQFALARENAEYQKRNKERQDAYKADEDAAKLSYEQRLRENKARLDEELAFLNKHKDAVKIARNTMLLDEIELLNRGRKEQLADQQQQRKDLKTTLDANLKSLKDGLKKQLEAIKKQSTDVANQYGAMGRNSANKFKSELIKNVAMSTAEARKFYGNLADSYAPGFSTQTYKLPGGKTQTVVTPNFAEGGYTGRGDKYEPKGIVHGGEYVVPKNMVNQNTGLPKPEALAALSGTTNTTNNSNVINLSVNMSGVLADSNASKRKFAEDMMKMIEQVLQQRGLNFSFKG